MKLPAFAFAFAALFLAAGSVNAAEKLSTLAKPASADKPQTAKKPAPPAEDEEPRSFIDASASLGVGSRHFDYRDTFSTNLRSYDLGAAPLASLSVAVYPLAHEMRGIPGDLGLVGDYTQALFVSSKSGDGSEADTTWRTFDLGIRGRFRTGVSPLPILGASIKYGQTSFDVSSAATPFAAAPPPSIHYSYVRLGLDGRVDLAPFAITAGLGYEDVFGSTDAIRSFTRASVNGVDLNLGAAYAVRGDLEIRASVAYTRFFASLNPQPGDAFVAGGALDQFETATLGVAYVR